MKHLITKFLFGKDSRISGLIALTVVMAVALGCTCGDSFDLSNIGKNDNSSSTSSNDSPFSIDSDSDSDSTDSEMPDDRLLKALVKSTTATFANAISTEDFSKLYEDASTDFKLSYTEEQMKDVFKTFIDKKRVILPILAKTVSMDPEFSPEPSIRTEQGLSILVANGKYNTKPVPLRFEYEYVKRNDQWKMLKLVVKLTE